MKLDELAPNEGARHKSKRGGRGIGSGKGKTAGRGSKGQHARNTVRPGFEGGQTPLHRRLPRRRGFNNIFATHVAVVNLGDLAQFEAGTEVTPDLLIKHRLIRDLQVSRDEEGKLVGLDGEIKILGNGEIPHALTVRAHRFSKSAREKIEASSGSAEVIS